MSHSVFRDLDDDKTSGNGTGADVAENNLIVFIGKDGDVQVDPNALQDLIVNANTDTKSTVSVIRLGSPTPSMETDDDDNLTKQSDADEDDQSDGDASKNSDDSNAESDDDDTGNDKSHKQKKKKKKNKVPGIGLTVEDFYNPEQAIQFATEIMNIAGITNPKQMKADYEHLRHIIQNDHCYTPYTYADSLANESKTEEPSDSVKKDVKTKSKVPVAPAQSSAPRKPGRPPLSSKLTPSNGLDKESIAARNRSVDDANSSTENTADRTSDEEEAESETDFSDLSVSESDNDRDSDLDFSVNDCHSRRSKKIKKRKIRAKRLANKKRRRSTVDYTGSDDGTTPNRKKVAKIPKKSLNTSAKSVITVSPTVSTTLKVPATSITPKTPAVSTSLKSPAVTSTPRITKVLCVKETPQTSQHDNAPKITVVQKTNTTTTTPQVTLSSDNKPKGNIIVVKQKEKKVQPDNVILSGMSSLFAPDVIRKNTTENIGSAVKSQVVTPPIVRVVESISKPLVTPIVTQTYSVQTPQSTMPRITTTTRMVKVPIATYRRIQKPAMNLASEQDKQLDLIDSLVQEELSKPTEPEPSLSSSSRTVIPAAIPNIVKMLETSEVAPSIQSTELVQPSSTSNTMSINYTTTQSVHESQMLPDDLLESFVNSDYLSDDLMQHVAKLVEDKNIQEVIDQQVLGVDALSSCSSVSQPQVQTVSVIPKATIVQTTPSTPAPKPIVNLMKSPSTPINVTPTAYKEGIRVKRADGRIITLPPIEAPTTRGAKRRAETTPGGTEIQQKQQIFTVIVQTESPSQNPHKNSPSTPTIQTIKAPPSVLSKAKPIVVRERRSSVAVKRASIDSKPRRSMSISNPPPVVVGDDDDDDDDDKEDPSDGNSEDDPHRLWCICRTPHNNRFMICCDKCEEWFHGKCVGITRQMGREMEERRIDWNCPNCTKKQQPSIKNIFPRKVVVENPSTKTKEAGSSSLLVSQSSSGSTVSNCIVCGIKPSRATSVYCSDDCIRKHATKTVSSTASSGNESEPSLAQATSSLKSPPERERKTIQLKMVPPSLFKDRFNHVVLFDKATGRFVSGKNAPTPEKLQQWLNEHPQHEILKPGTPQAIAFKAKQQQLKTIAREMEAEKELFAVTQPVKIQTKLRFEADKMVYVNPTTQKHVVTTAVKRPISASSSSPVHSKSPANKIEHISKTPKLTATAPVQKKRTSHTPETKTGNQHKPESSGSKSNERDRLRVSARKSLIEQLIIRTKEITNSNAPRLTENEITDFVNAAEKEMFEMFGSDTNLKYKSKYRSLMYNIKDRKNLTLFEKISSKLIEPKQLVKLSTDELASQELAKWRENENKHQLEMITKSELDMLAQGNSYVLKTHKGEEVIQESSERITLDPLIPVQDVVSVLNSSAVSSSDTTAPTKDSRLDKYLSPDGKSSSYSTSSKKDGDRSHEKKDRHESRSSSSSSKHKRKRSRERHSSHNSHSHSHSHKDKSHDKDRKDRTSSSTTSDRKDKKDHKSSSSSSSSSSTRSKHQIDKDRKRESTSKTHSTTPKVQKIDEHSIIDKILKAQSTIDSILHPEEFKKNEPAVASTSDGSALTRQPSVANESDQEPTSTVTIPSPPETSQELRSTTTTPPPIEKEAMPLLWSGSISMVDVATFQVSLSTLSGSTAMIEFPKEFDIVGRINPETVWDYLEKIRISKDIALVRFSPRSSSEDDETAYSTFISYLDTRKRLGVIKFPSKFVKDFYIMPLTSHKSLPSILKTTTGFDFGADRPDLLLGIIVRNRISQSNHQPTPPKHRQSLPFIAHKPAATAPAKDAHYTPPSSPNMNSQVQAISKQVIKATFSSNLDDDEPYSPGGSDEDDLSLNTIPTSYLSSTTANPIQIPDYAKPVVANFTSCDKQQLAELNRQIEAEKKQIAMHLQTADIDEPYSPTSSVSPPINTNISDVVSNISIPANLADILKNVASFGSTTGQLQISQYTASLMDTSETEYVPVASASSISYAPTTSQMMQSLPVSSQPSKLAQLTDEELLRLVPDEID